MITFWKSLVILAAIGASAYGQVPEQASPNVQASTSIPKHLELARELVATVKPENNKYVLNHGSGVRWKGDLFNSESSVNTACGGFVAAVMERAGNTSIDVVKSKTSSHILRVKQFLEAVANDWGFSKVSKVGEIVPGDLFLFRCNDRCVAAETNNFLGHKTVTEVDAAGHVTIVDVKPTQKKPTPPLIDGTQQWLVTVIDSSESPHDLKDTRWRAKSEPPVTGVGRGTYRVYTDMDGVPVGYTNGPNGQKLHTIKDRPILIGRPQAK
jgi:hypothetical protein